MTEPALINSSELQALLSKHLSEVGILASHATVAVDEQDNSLARLPDLHWMSVRGKLVLAVTTAVLDLLIA